MNKIKKSVPIQMNGANMGDFGDMITYEIQSYYPLEACLREIFIEVDEPETIKEFLKVHNITKTELVEWLNQNYK